MNDKNAYLLFPRAVGPEILYLWKPLWIDSDNAIHSCRIRFAVVDGKLKMIMRAYLKTDWTEGMNKDAMKDVYPIGEYLLLPNSVKATLFLCGFNKINELQSFLTHELFAYDDTTVFVDEDEFYQYKEEHFFGWTKRYMAEGAKFDDFF